MNKRHNPRRNPEGDILDYYRPGVGIVLMNADGMVFVGERLDNPGAWQMPQGGIDDGEKPETAVFREMKEEIGTDKARIMAVMEDWITYDIPAKTARKLWGGKYRGQKQKWIALEFTGEDSDIDLEADKHPEFGQWKWVPINELLKYVVRFKRDVYKRVIKEFAHCAEELQDRKPPKAKKNAPSPDR
jgi:putative (di)nucleoside polyphosphate hydrolase